MIKKLKIALCTVSLGLAIGNVATMAMNFDYDFMSKVEQDGLSDMGIDDYFKRTGVSDDDIKKAVNKYMRLMRKGKNDLDAKASVIYSIVYGCPESIIEKLLEVKNEQLYSGKGEIYSNAYARYIVINKELVGIAELMANAYKSSFIKGKSNIRCDAHAKSVRDRMIHFFKHGTMNLYAHRARYNAFVLQNIHSKKFGELPKIAIKRFRKMRLNELIKRYSKSGMTYEKILSIAYGVYNSYCEEYMAIAQQMADEFTKSYIEKKNIAEADECAEKIKAALKRDIKELQEKYKKLGKNDRVAKMWAMYVIAEGVPENIAMKMAEIYDIKYNNGYCSKNKAEHKAYKEREHLLKLKENAEKKLRKQGKSEVYIKAYIDYLIFYDNFMDPWTGTDEYICRRIKLEVKMMAKAYEKEYNRSCNEIKADEYARKEREKIEEIIEKEYSLCRSNYMRLKDFFTYVEYYLDAEVPRPQAKIIVDSYIRERRRSNRKIDFNEFKREREATLNAEVLELSKDYRISGKSELFVRMCAIYSLIYKESKEMVIEMASAYEKEYKKSNSMFKAETEAEKVRYSLNNSLKAVIKKYKALGKKKVYIEAYSKYRVFGKEQSEIANRMAEVYERKYNNFRDTEIADECAREERDRLKKEIKKFEAKYKEMGKSEIFSNICATYIVVYEESEEIAMKMAEVYESTFASTGNIYKADKNAKIFRSKIVKESK